MPTPSNSLHSNPARSVFSNFGSVRTDTTDDENQPVGHPAVLAGEATQVSLQAAIDAALARAFVYQFVANALDYPSSESWRRLTAPETQTALQSATNSLAPKSDGALWTSAVRCLSAFQTSTFASFLDEYLVVFGHAARGPCPINEIEYGDLKADPLFQPHRLADLAAFYRAFGLELTDDATERQDHLSIELEFMSVLAAKEGYAREHQLDEELTLCLDAEKKFLREHVGRWVPAFAWRLSKSLPVGALVSLVQFIRDFIQADCHRFGILPGSEDLRLRPVDEGAESLCTSCGIQNLPPGALTTT